MEELTSQLAASKESLKKEAVTLHQAVASLERKLESTEKQRKDALVRLADAVKGHFFHSVWPSVHNSKGQLGFWLNCILLLQ